jgi:hypothetical protein
LVNKKLLLAAVFCFAAAAAGGDTVQWRNKGVVNESVDIAGYLGFTLSEAVQTFGPPEEVFVYRGEEEWQDNVVFYFQKHLYLFWFENRVWQVRLDERYEGEIAGFSMGTRKEDITAALGEPFFEDNESCLYALPDMGVPVRMRLFFEEGRLSDLYIFRADF